MYRSQTIAIVFFIFAGIYLALPVKAHADSVIDRYFTGSYLRVDLLDDQITGTRKFDTELDLRYRQNDFSGFVRASNYRPFPFQEDGFRIQKRGINYSLDDWDISLGDFSVVFARGASLSATEDRGADRDAQLDGIKVTGNMDWANVVFFWGQHRSNALDYYISGNNTNERTGSDQLNGFRSAFNFDPVKIGVSYVDARVADFFNRETDLITEADASVDLGNVDLYYETSWFNRVQTEENPGRPDGRAQLAEITYSQRGVSLQGSWVRNTNAHFSYGIAPSLRRYELDDSAAKSNDETGYRFDFRLSPEAWEGYSLRLLYANLEGIENKNMTFENYFIELTSPPQNEWSGILSYDVINGFQQYYGGVDGTERAIRAALDGPNPLGGNFHLYGRYRTLSNLTNNDDELQLGLDFHINSVLTVGMFRETSTREDEPPISGFAGIPTASPGEWKSFFVTYAPDPWNSFELKFGSERGGFKCSGGVCAQYPPFKGVMFTYYRYF
jgi:hypothetical protein